MTRIFVLLTAIGALYAYLGWRLSPALDVAVWLILFLAIALLFSFAAIARREEENDGLATSILRWAIYFDMAYFSFVLALTIFRDVVFVPVVWLYPSLSVVIFGSSATWLMLGLAFLFVIVGAVWANLGPYIKEVEVVLPDLHEDLQGLRIAQISDLHIGPTIGRRYVSRVVAQVNQLQPHLTVLTGDIADGSVRRYEREAQTLSQLLPLNNVFYVPGNHEYYWDAPAWIQIFEELGLKALLNRHEIVEFGRGKMMIAGVVDPAARMFDATAGPRPDLALGKNAGADLKLLLAHQPGIAREAEGLGFDIQLSGHTHAGQFFPWTLVVSRVHEVSKGLKKIGRMWVYVNPGTGSWGPPIRLGTTTEITLLKLVRRQLS